MMTVFRLQYGAKYRTLVVLLSEYRDPRIATSHGPAGLLILIA